MKKVLLLIAVVAVLSGCGANDKLTCTYDNTVGDVTSKTEYVIEYRNNNIKKIKATYDYKSNHVDGVGTGTDGTTNDKDDNKDNDGILGGTVSSRLELPSTDSIDISGIKTRHDSKFGTYTNIKGFTSDVNVNDDTNYKVIYTYDLNTLSDNDINNLGINRDLNTFKTTLTNRGLTCK